MTVAQAVKRLRKQLGNFSQSRLALHLGLTPNAVARWEQGLKEPSPESCRRLAAVADGELSRFFAARGGATEAELDYYSKTGGHGLTQLARTTAEKVVEARIAGLAEGLREALTRIEKLEQAIAGIQAGEPAAAGIAGAHGIEVQEPIRVAGDTYNAKRQRAKKL